MSDSVKDWHDRHIGCDHGPFGPYNCETESPSTESLSNEVVENQDRAPMRVSDVSDYEVEREYRYPDHSLTIVAPWRVFIAESGSHRVQTHDGNVHYIPQGWISLSWKPKDIDDPVKF